MKIYSVYDKQFKEYGCVIGGDYKSLLKELSTKPCPEDATIYVPSDDGLEATPEAKRLQTDIFGGLPVQVGYCNGRNNLLNCLEYHKSSEVNIVESDTVLLLGRLQDIEDGKYDTGLVKAFNVPAGVAVEMYATTLHYAPCRAQGLFRVAVVLPKGTNYDKPHGSSEAMLWGSNKWLIAHPDSSEAAQGAHVGLTGKNIKVV